MSLVLEEGQSFSLSAYVQSPRKYKLPDETRRKMSLAHKGKQISEETRRKISIALKGRKPSEESKLKMRMSQKGKQLSEETKRKLSLALKGRPFSEEHKRNMSLAEKGRVNVGKIPWIKGKHCSEEVRQRLSKIHKGNHYSLRTEWKRGNNLSKETLEKISRALKGRQLSEEHKRKISINRLNQILPQKDTSIEVKMQDEFKNRGVLFKKHLAIGDICQPDIVILEKRVVVFCDGDYWHNLAKMKHKDESQDKRLKENGWRVYRFWEREINQSPSDCVNKVMGEIGC